MREVLELVEAALERNDANDVDGFVEYQAPDCDWQTPDGPMHGRDAVREYVGRFRLAFPDGRHTIDRAVEIGDAVAIEGRWRGTHTGALETPQGELPATGRTVELPFALIVEADRVIRQARRVAIYIDHLAILAQMGLLPEPTAA